MDEVNVEKLIQKFKDSGELESEDPALLMLKKWPTAKQYQENSEKLSGLEKLVCNLDMELLSFHAFFFVWVFEMAVFDDFWGFISHFELCTALK